MFDVPVATVLIVSLLVMVAMGVHIAIALGMTSALGVFLVTGSFDAVVISFSHLLFNITGIVLWWPLKNLPITLAEKFADYATRNKLIPVAYVLLLFFIFPLIIIYFSN